MMLPAGALKCLHSSLYRRSKHFRFTRDFQHRLSTYPKIRSFWTLRGVDLRPMLYVLPLALFLHFFANHIGFVARTIGPSMVPTISAKGDCVLISRLHKRGRDVKVGDLVDFVHPLVPGMGAIKRVVGMPGDFVVRQAPAGGGEVVLGERGLVERLGGGDPYGGHGKETRMLQIPEGHCWVLGDNLPESRDSRAYGPLPLGLIKGKVVAKVWPLREAKWIVNNLQPLSEEI